MNASTPAFATAFSSAPAGACPENLLAAELATCALEHLDQHTFTVSADLSRDKPETLVNFRKFQEVLMMAYRQGQASVAPFAPAAA